MSGLVKSINERLFLIIPIYDDQEQIIAYVHSSPLSREIFEANFLLVSKTFAAIHGEGLGEIAGPRVAALMLKQVAQHMSPSDPDRLWVPLLNEIRRLTNLLRLSSTAWEMVPFQEAIDKSMLNADDLAEVENALVYFTVCSAMQHRRMAAVMLPGAARLWGAQISSSPCTAFLHSLPTSTTTETTVAPSPAAVQDVAEGPPAPPVQVRAREASSRPF